MNRAVADRIAKTEWGRRLISEPRHRTIMTATAGFFLNLLFALYHGVLGIINLSLWFMAMCAYYSVLGSMRLSAVLCECRSGGAASKDTERFVMKLSGVLLIILSFVLTGVIYVSLSQNIATKYHEIVMITIAAYTFCKIAAAIVKAVRQHKNPSASLAVIRNIGYAEVAASVLTLQRSMLVSFGTMSSEEMRTMNALTGAAVCLFVLMLGILMTIPSEDKGRHGFSGHLGRLAALSSSPGDSPASSSALPATESAPEKLHRTCQRDKTGAGKEEDEGGLVPTEDDDTASVDLSRWQARCPLSTEGTRNKERMRRHGKIKACAGKQKDCGRGGQRL